MNYSMSRGMTLLSLHDIHVIYTFTTEKASCATLFINFICEQMHSQLLVGKALSVNGLNYTITTPMQQVYSGNKEGWFRRNWVVY